PAHDADGALKFFAIDPELAVEGFRGKPGAEPVGRVLQVTLARQKLLAGPVSADAVKFLRHPPAGHVHRAVPALGEQEPRRGLVLLVRLGTLRRLTADALLLGLVAAQFAKMLAGAFLDG